MRSIPIKVISVPPVTGPIFGIMSIRAYGGPMGLGLGLGLEKGASRRDSLDPLTPRTLILTLTLTPK
jgi:hypothetical protein